MKDNNTMTCAAPRGCGCDLWNRGAACQACAERNCPELRQPVNQNNPADRIESYIRLIINDAFVADKQKPDFRYMLMTLSDMAYILILDTKNRSVIRRVGYRLYKNFKKHFGKDIFVFNATMNEVSLKEDAYPNTGYGIRLMNSMRESATFDANHTVAYLRNTMFGDISVSIFPADDGPLAGSLYPGYSSIPTKSRSLFADIKRLHNGDTYRCKGRPAWNSYLRDYAELCDGLAPDHTVKVTVVSELNCICNTPQDGDKKPTAAEKTPKTPVAKEMKDKEQPTKDEPVTAEPVSTETTAAGQNDDSDGVCESCMVHYPEEEPSESYD